MNHSDIHLDQPGENIHIGEMDHHHHGTEENPENLSKIKKANLAIKGHFG